MPQTPALRMPLLSKILLLDVALVGLMLLLSIWLSSRYSVELLEERLDQNQHHVAQLLATSDAVVNALRAGRSNPALDAYLDAALTNQNDIDVITIADMNSIRLYHPEKSRVGERFFGGDEGRVLKGENYVTRGQGTLGYQSRYFYPVLDHEGKQLGFVLVSMLMSNLENLRDNVIRVHLQTLAVVLLVGILAAGLLTVNIKRSLLGFEPAQLAQRFLQRGEVIDSLEEGLLAVDGHGRIIITSTAAQEILGKDEHRLRGRDVDEVFPQGRLKESLAGVRDYNRRLTVREQNILCDRIPVHSGQAVIGAVAIMRDRSEFTRMAEQLTGVSHLLDALRANTHEFMNQLHVILGLLQAGNIEDAKRYIMDIGQVQSATVSALAKGIENRALAALILGKVNRCNELGIRMLLLPDSRIPRRSRFLPTKALITIVGNLVENAVDAISERGFAKEEHEIALRIHEDEQGLLISLDDSGVGLTAEEMSRFGTPGYTSKGPGHGTGLGLVYGILESAGGEISLESEKGVGTSITLVFSRPRHLRPEIEEEHG